VKCEAADAASGPPHKLGYNTRWRRRLHRVAAGGPGAERKLATTNVGNGEDAEEAEEEEEEEAEEEEEQGSLDARIWSLALPAVAALLLDPVLGAVDTGFVGRIEGEGAAAALGGLAVATTVFNFSFKLFNFLAVVTGPLVATQISAAKKAEKAGTGAAGAGRAAAADTVAGAMTLALVLGFGALATLELGSDTIIGLAGGNTEVTPTTTEAAAVVGSGDGDGSTTATPPTTAAAVGGGDGEDGAATLMSEAESYLRIRALSAPAVLVETVAIGAYRGLLDTRTPLLVSGAANFVNLVLDPILIFGLGPVPAFGVAGAAAATAAAEWGSAAVFWVMLTREGLLPPLGGLPRTDSSSSSGGGGGGGGGGDGGGDDSGGSGAAGAVSEWARKLKPLAAGSASQLARTLLLQAVLVRATAEAVGVGAAGAHQICIQVWWVTLFALDALAVAAQSLVAAALGAGDVAAARGAADRTLKWALAAGTAVGVGLYAAGPLVPAVFTNDAATAAAATGPLRLVAALQPLNAAVFVGDGVLQGAADFDYLALAMAAAAAPALGSLAVTGAAGAGLDSVWQSMALLQVGRAGTLAARYWGADGPVSLPLPDVGDKKEEEQEEEKGEEEEEQ